METTQIGARRPGTPIAAVVLLVGALVTAGLGLVVPLAQAPHLRIDGRVTSTLIGLILWGLLVAALVFVAWRLGRVTVTLTLILLGVVILAGSVVALTCVEYLTASSGMTGSGFAGHLFLVGLVLLAGGSAVRALARGRFF